MRKLAFLSTVLLTLAIAPTAFAAPPTRDIQPSQDDVVITDQCVFPVLAHIDGSETIKVFTDTAGVPVKQIQTFPGNRLTLTNTTSGTSLSLMATGATIVRAQSEGGVSVQITGHGPFVPNPLTGEPGIWYLTGRGTATFDAQGNQTSVTIAGRLDNLCPQLAT